MTDSTTEAPPRPVDDSTGDHVASAGVASDSSASPACSASSVGRGDAGGGDGQTPDQRANDTAAAAAPADVRDAASGGGKPGRTLAWVLVIGLLSALGSAAATYWAVRATTSTAAPAASAGASAGAGAAESEAEGGANAGPPPAQVVVSRAQRRAVSRTTDVVGRLEQVRRTRLSAEVEGKITALSVEEGDRVSPEGQVLARIDEVWAKLAARSAEAAVEAARVRHDQAVRDRDYLMRLEASGSAKRKEVEDAVAQAEATLQELRMAEAEYERALERVRRLEVVPPFEGVVIEKLAEVGQWVSVGEPIVEMISVDELDAVVDVPESLINAVGVGDEVSVTVGSIGQTVRGEVVAATPFSANEARTFPVKIRVDDLDGRLKAGMSVTAAIPTGRTSSALTVPRDGVQFTGMGPRMWIASGGSSWSSQAGAGSAARARDDRASEAGASGGPASEAGASETRASGDPALEDKSRRASAAGGGAGGGQGGGGQGGGGAMPRAVSVPVEVIFEKSDFFAVEVRGRQSPRVTEKTPIVVQGAESLMPGQPLILEWEGDGGGGRAGSGGAGAESGSESEGAARAGAGNAAR